MVIELLLKDFEGRFEDPTGCAFCRALNRAGFPCMNAGTLSATVKKDGRIKEFIVTGVFVNHEMISSPMYGFGAIEYDKVKDALLKNPSTTAYLQLRED